MANVNALMGIGLDDMQQQQAMADSLRGQQGAADFMSLSSIAPVAQMGQNLNQSVDNSAVAVGGLNKARKLANAKVQAATTLNDRSVLAKTVENDRKKRADKLIADAKLSEADTQHFFDPALGQQVNLNQRTDGVYTYPNGEEVPEQYVRSLQALSKGTGKGRGGSGSGGRALDKPIITVNNDSGEVASIVYDENLGHWKNADTNERVTRSEYTKKQSLSDTEREGLLSDLSGIRNINRYIGSMPEEAFDKDSDVVFQSQIRNTLGSMFPYAEEGDWISPSGAGFWRDKKRFTDMIIRNEMFGSALTDNEIKEWASANVSPNNTFAQGMQALEDLRDKAMEKNVARIDAHRNRGVSNRELASLGLRPEDAQRHRDNAKLRTEGWRGMDYNTLRKEAAREKTTIKGLIEALIEEESMAGGQ